MIHIRHHLTRARATRYVSFMGIRSQCRVESGALGRASRSEVAEKTPALQLWKSQHTRRTSLIFQGTQFGLTVAQEGFGIISVQGNTRSVSMPLSTINTQVLFYTFCLWVSVWGS